MDKFIFEMTEDELAAIDLPKFTGLQIGDRVTHANAGQHGGNGTTISNQQGTVMGFQNQGTYHWGGLCVTVTVKWDDGEQYDMVYTLAKKVA